MSLRRLIRLEAKLFADAFEARVLEMELLLRIIDLIVLARVNLGAGHPRPFVNCGAILAAAQNLRPNRLVDVVHIHE